MNIRIAPGPLSGTAEAPPSKSFAHRELILAALSDKPCFIKLGSVSEDIEATVRCLSSVGASISRRADGFGIVPVSGVPDAAVLDCGESGSTLRFMMPICAALGISAKFICRGRLGERPLGPLRAQLEAHGIRFASDHEISGKLNAGEYLLPGNVSSQYVTGLLLALSLLDKPSVIRLTSPLESASYVGITAEAMRKYGATVQSGTDSFTVCGIGKFRSPGTSGIEGDWSNGSFWLAAGVKVRGLSLTSAQGDRAMVRVMEKMGASVEESGGCIQAIYSTLGAADVNASDIPDIVPPVALLCAASDGECRITGAARLRLKESDRIKSVCATLRSLGADAEEREDGMVIRGRGALRGGVCDSYGDHRIAMTAAIASRFCTGDITVLGAEAVNKSYPDFWEDFRSLGGKFEIIG